MQQEKETKQRLMECARAEFMEKGFLKASLRTICKEAPEGGTACYAKTLKREKFGNNLDVTLLGLTKDNPYFDADVKKGMNRVILSSAAAQKYQLKKGDKIVLTDEEEDRDYTFTVDGVTEYSTGLYVFMNIDSMRELFSESFI